MDVLLLMPVYNEEDCIGNVVNSWLDELATHSDVESYQIMIVNDGSTDNTQGVLEKLENEHGERMVIVNQANAGHGAAIMTGYHRAVKTSADYVFQTDSDDQLLPSDFDKLWSRRTESDMLLARRLQRDDPFSRLVITRILRAFLSLYFSVSIPDSNNPYRLFKKTWLAAQLEKIPENSLAPNIMLSVIAAKQKVNLQHIGVNHQKRATGKSVLVSKKLITLCFNVVHQLREFKKKL